MMINSRATATDHRPPRPHPHTASKETTTLAAASVYSVPEWRPGSVRNERERKDDSHQLVPDAAAAAPGAPTAASLNSGSCPSDVTGAAEPQALEALRVTPW
jgi:hypothetical protein